MSISEQLKEKQQREIAAMLTALTLLGIVAIWGGRVFYPFWLICAAIHLYQTVENYNGIDREPPVILIFLQILFYTAMSPFYLLMSTYLVIIVAVETWLELRKDEPEE
jgi:hypothetical protein